LAELKLYLNLTFGYNKVACQMYLKKRGKREKGRRRRSRLNLKFWLECGCFKKKACLKKRTKTMANEEASEIWADRRR